MYLVVALAGYVAGVVTCYVLMNWLRGL